MPFVQFKKYEKLSWKSVTFSKVAGSKSYKVVPCAIWYHLYNLVNLKNAHGEVLLLVKLQIKVTLLHGCFSRLLICTKVQNRATHLMILYQLTKFQYPENKVSFFGETKGIFHIFCSAFFW